MLPLNQNRLHIRKNERRKPHAVLPLLKGHARRRICKPRILRLIDKDPTRPNVSKRDGPQFLDDRRKVVIAEYLNDRLWPKADSQS
jgi:hypothetical protein